MQWEAACVRIAREYKTYIGGSEMRINQSPTLCSGSPPSFARKHLKGSLSFHNSTGGVWSLFFLLMEQRGFSRDRF